MNAETRAFAALLGRMTAAAVAGDGAAVRACFTPAGVYHDCFYGSFAGDAIVGMIEGMFHRDATRFIWDLHDPMAEGSVAMPAMYSATNRSCLRLRVVGRDSRA